MHKYCDILLVGGSAVFCLCCFLRWMSAIDLERYIFVPQSKTPEILFECPHISAAGQFALDQLNYYTYKTRPRLHKLWPKMNNATDYTWTVSATVEAKKCFVIVLLEKQQANQYSRGGSSFIVRAKGHNHLYVCPVRDFFNGTYYVYCQIVPDCINITVQLQYINFCMFASVSLQWLNRQVATLSKCFNQTPEPSSFYGWKKAYPRNVSSPMLWHDNEGFSKYMTVTDISKCLTEKVEKLFMIGNSHMRITFQYLMNALGLMTEKNLNLADGYVNYSFEHKYSHSCLPYASDVASAIRWQNDNGWPLFNTFQMSSNLTFDVAKGQLDNCRLNVVIVSIGEQDVKAKSTLSFNQVDVPKLTSAITDMTRVFATVNCTRVIYVTQPPVGNRYKQRNTGLLRLATMGAASAATINALSNNTNITIIDGYTMQLPRYEESIDGIHFTMPQYAGRDKKLVFNGDVGIAVMMKILKTFC